MTTRTPFGALWVILCAAVCAPAQAQQSDDERARIHFEAGRSYFDEGDYERAVEEWQRSFALSGRVQLLLNIATTYERLARYGEAADALERYVNDAQPDDADVLRRRIENLRERARAHEATTPEPEVPATEPAQAAEAPPGPEQSAAPVDESGGGLPTVSLISYIAAGVGLATFATFGALALSEESEVADGCGATRSCSDEDLDPIDTKALVADVGLGVALVGAAVGTVFLLTSGSGGDESQASVSPLLGPGTAGASAQVRF